MYSSLSNQLYHLLHFGLAFYVIFFVIPKILFRQDKEDKLENFFINFSKMVILIIGIGYLFLILKIYEVLAIIALLSVYLSVRNVKTNHEKKPSIRIAYLFDFFDGHIRVHPNETYVHGKKMIRRSLNKTVLNLKTRIAENWAIIIVMTISAYIRIPDAILNPAPSMSDGVVTLDWMKYVNERILFHDGIYPQGFYFYLSLLSKFSFIDPLYILKYTGPLDTLLIILGIYFGISRMFNDKLAGAIAALIYGLLGYTFLGDDWVRQAATNSQEFAFIFIIPTLYFLFSYIKNGDKKYFSASFASVDNVGLIHAVAYVLILIGGASVVLSSIFKWRKYPNTFKVIGIGLGSGVVAILPIGIGFLYRIPFNSSSAQFASSSVSTQAQFPVLHAWDWIAIASMIVLFLISILLGKKTKDALAYFSLAWFTLITFLLYYMGGIVTHSLALISRTLDLWALVAPVALAVAIHALIIYFNEVTLSVKTASFMMIFLILGSIVYSRPTPIFPYKMQWEDDVNAYLQINQSYKHIGYLIVASNENYAIVLGNGYLLSTSNFLKMFNPKLPPLTQYGTNHIDRNIPIDVFIYVEKKIYEVHNISSIMNIETPIYHREEFNMKKLYLWIKEFKSRYPNNLSVFYESKHLIVYHLQVRD